MKLKEWSAFILLGLVWGSSFLWIKIALREIGPFTLVAFRLLFGLIALLAIMRLQRQTFPRDRRTLLAFLFLGVFNTALPFVLISWGETSIDSALASILNGTMPLFTIVIAHFWLHDEKITLTRLGGLIVGFVGVSEHAVGQCGVHGAGDDVAADHAGFFDAAKGSSVGDRLSAGRQTRTGQHGGDGVEDMVFGLLHDRRRERPAQGGCDVGAQLAHDRSDLRFGLPAHDIARPRTAASAYAILSSNGREPSDSHQRRTRFSVRPVIRYRRLLARSPGR